MRRHLVRTEHCGQRREGEATSLCCSDSLPATAFLIGPIRRALVLLPSITKEALDIEHGDQHVLGELVNLEEGRDAPKT